MPLQHPYPCPGQPARPRLYERRGELDETNARVRQQSVADKT